MVAERKPLDAIFASATLDGSGDGVASIGPTRVRERWFPATVGVTVSTAVNEPACKIFAGPQISAATYIDGTGTGSFDSTDSIASSVIHVGERIFAQWKGGDPGAVATMTVTGEYQVGS